MGLHLDKNTIRIRLKINTNITKMPIVLDGLEQFAYPGNVVSGEVGTELDVARRTGESIL